jgi:hypothetical protein
MPDFTQQQPGVIPNMRKHLVSAAVAGALTLAALAPMANAQGSDLAELKAQLAALQSKVEELEKQQKAQVESQDRTTDVLAQTRAGVGEWVGRFQWKGDFRFRNENIDQEFVAKERNRDRIRLRAGFFARVNDTLRVEMQAATTEGFDARSSNQTLTNTNSRKSLELDLAYAEWQPNANWKATFGKMRLPWYTTQSFFFDKDVNPEGVALGWQQGATGLFANAYYIDLAERSARADSNMAGAQLGWRGDVASGMRLTLAAGYFAHNAIEGYNTVQDTTLPGNAFGNTVGTGAACRTGIASCLVNDYDVLEVSADLAMTLAGRPFTIFADYGNNGQPEAFGTTPDGLDTAWALGFQWGRVTGARTWEIGYIHQVTEKDALFAQWIDSDFASGLTDGDGGAFRFGYGFGRNFRINATYFLNDLNNDVASANGFDVEYKRLQLDVNMSF